MTDQERQELARIRGEQHEWFRWFYMTSLTQEAGTTDAEPKHKCED